MALVKPSSPVFNPAHPLSKGLVGAWLMSEGGGSTLYDAGARHIGGTITGATWVQTQWGWALDFTASSSTYASISGLPSLSSAFSFFVLWRMDVLRSYNGVIYKGPGAAPQPFEIWVKSDGLCQYNYGNNAATIQHQKTGMVAQTWYTSVGTYNGATVTSYLNAIQFATTNSTAPGDSTANNLLLGKRADNGTLLDGQIAAAMVFDRALVYNEIIALHHDPYAAFRPTPTRIGLSIAAATTTVALTWTDNSVGETGYSIERSTDGINYSEIGTAAADATSYNDDTAALATTYYYRVKATGSPADSDYSNVATITTA